MTWTVASASERHRALTHDDTGTWRADPATSSDIRVATGQPVMIVPNGSPYQAAGPDDEVWLYLAAQAVIPGPLKVTGDPPAIPDVAATPPGVVC